LFKILAAPHEFSDFVPELLVDVRRKPYDSVMFANILLDLSSVTRTRKEEKESLRGFTP